MNNSISYPKAGLAVSISCSKNITILEIPLSYSLAILSKTKLSFVWQDLFSTKQCWLTLITSLFLTSLPITFKNVFQFQVFIFEHPFRCRNEESSFCSARSFIYSQLDIIRLFILIQNYSLIQRSLKTVGVIAII